MKTLTEYKNKFGAVKGEINYHIDKALELQSKVTKKPTVKKPATKKPATKKPATKKPAVKKVTNCKTKKR